MLRDDNFLTLGSQITLLVINFFLAHFPACSFTRMCDTARSFANACQVSFPLVRSCLVQMRQESFEITLFFETRSPCFISLSIQSTEEWKQLCNCFLLPRLRD